MENKFVSVWTGFNSAGNMKGISKNFFKNIDTRREKLIKEVELEDIEMSNVKIEY